MWHYRDYAEAQEGIVEGFRTSIITWKPTSASASSPIPSREFQARSITLEYRSVDVRKMHLTSTRVGLPRLLGMTYDSGVHMEFKVRTRCR